MNKNKYFTYALFIILFLIFWNLFDYLFKTFFAELTYQFNMNNLIIPFVISIVIGYLIFIKEK